MSESLSLKGKEKLSSFEDNLNNLEIGDSHGLLNIIHSEMGNANGNYYERLERLKVQVIALIDEQEGSRNILWQAILHHPDRYFSLNNEKERRERQASTEAKEGGYEKVWWSDVDTLELYDWGIAQIDDVIPDIKDPTEKNDLLKWKQRFQQERAEILQRNIRQEDEFKRIKNSLLVAKALNN
jgi:hypothetical protein